MTSITPAELANLCQHQPDLEILDVRTPAEFTAAHCKYARNLPLSDFNAREYVKSMGNPEKAVYVLCQTGARARKAAEALEAAGCKQVIHVEGGTAAWLAAGLPANKGRQILSLEQQVRIAAGTLVVLGCALAYLVHPYFLGLAAFVGAGLVFAGLTNTCGMAMVLARMPWNQMPAASKVNCQAKNGIDETASTQGVR